jgi:hypothetical protein
MRYPIDIKELGILITLWEKGLDNLQEVINNSKNPRKLENCERLFGLGKYMLNTIKTVVNIKKWYLTTMELKMCPNAQKAAILLDDLVEIEAHERNNVLDTIYYVERDSRLGWEPSMEYVCDKWHLEWKLR